LKNGISSFQEHEILELLLYFAIPFKDTNEIAHELLNEFGSLPNVLSANPDYLKSFKNMTDNATFLLKFTKDISQKYYVDKDFSKDVIDSQEKLCEFLKKQYASLDKETVFLFLLDKPNCITDCIKMHEGTESVSEVKIGDIAKIANTRNISKVIISHNHPDNSPVSTNDIVSTKKIAFHLKSVDIDLCESYVVTNNKVIGILKMING
jgi:DNA repair protein RadC